MNNPGQGMPARQESQMKAFERDPRFVSRMRAMDIIFGAMAAAIFGYIVILESGILRPHLILGLTPITWKVFAASMLACIPAAFITGKLLLGSVWKASSFDEATQKATLTSIVVFALCESVGLGDLMSHLLMAPLNVSYAMMALSIASLIAAIFLLRPRIRQALLYHLSNENSPDR